MDRLLREAGAAERAAIERALVRDPELESELRAILASLPGGLRPAFERAFLDAITVADPPASAIGAGLMAAIGEAQGRGRDEGGAPPPGGVEQRRG